MAHWPYHSYDWLCTNLEVDVVEHTYAGVSRYFLLFENDEDIDQCFVQSQRGQIFTQTSVAGLLQDLRAWPQPLPHHLHLEHWLEAIEGEPAYPTLLLPLDDLIAAYASNRLSASLFQANRCWFELLEIDRLCSYGSFLQPLQENGNSLQNLQTFLRLSQEKLVPQPHDLTSAQLLDRYSWNPKNLALQLHHLAHAFQTCLEQ